MVKKIFREKSKFDSKIDFFRKIEILFKDRGFRQKYEFLQKKNDIRNLKLWLGPSILSGIVVMIVLIPVNAVVGKRIGAITRALMKTKGKCQKKNTDAVFL